MRAFQITMFAAGVLSLLAALPFVGSVAGDALWRAGVGVFLLDIVCIMLWPGRLAGSAEAREAL